MNRQEKIAVITGASRGLGQQVALTLAAHDIQIALIARSVEPLQAAVEQIRAHGGTAISIAADLSDRNSIDTIKTAVESQLGQPSILINAAGVFGPIQLIQDSDPEAWIETLTINTIAPYLLCRAFVNGMIEQSWGRIINFTSAASLHPPGPLNSAYATSKVALNQFTRHLAAELDGTGVTANVIHPGDVKTEMWAYIRDEISAVQGGQGAAYQQWAEWVNQTGGDDPQKAADLVMRLLGEEAAHTTGRFLWIENGLQPPIPSWDEPTDQQPWRE